MRNARGQAAHMAGMLTYFRCRIEEAKRMPSLWQGLPKSFGMDPDGRRLAFDTWLVRHRHVVSRMRPLP